MERKHRPTAVVGGIVALLAMAMLASGCASGASATPGATATPAATATPKPPPTPTATPTPLPKIGTTVSVGNWEYKVTNAERAKTLTWSAFGNKEDAKGIWLVVYLTLKNVGKENYSINSWDFELKDQSGVTYKTSSALAASMFVSYKKLASLGEQYPLGVAANSALVFDIAPEAKGLRLWIVQAKTEIDLGQ